MQGTNSLTQGTHFSSDTQNSPLTHFTQDSRSLSQSCSPPIQAACLSRIFALSLNHSSPMQTISNSPTPRATRSTQGTSHPPSLPPDQGLLCHHTHDSNFPVISDPPNRPTVTSTSPNRTITHQKTPRNSLQPCDMHMLLNPGLPNRANILGRINTAVTSLVIGSPTSKSVCRPPASIVSNSFTKPNANVCSTFHSGNLKGVLSTSPSLVSILAAFLPITNHGSTQCDLRRTAIAVASFTLAFYPA